MSRTKQNSKRPNCKSPGPSTADFEEAAAEVFAEHYPNAIFILPAWLAGEVHNKIEVRFPQVTRLEVERAIGQMLEREQLWPFVVVGARLEDGADAIVYKLNLHRSKNIIQFPG
jgi:hypothetical protein